MPDFLAFSGELGLGERDLRAYEARGLLGDLLDQIPHGGGLVGSWRACRGAVCCSRLAVDLHVVDHLPSRAAGFRPAPLKTTQQVKSAWGNSWRGVAARKMPERRHAPMRKCWRELPWRRLGTMFAGAEKRRLPGASLASRNVDGPHSRATHTGTPAISTVGSPPGGRRRPCSGRHRAAAAPRRGRAARSRCLPRRRRGRRGRRAPHQRQLGHGSGDRSVSKPIGVERPLAQRHRADRGERPPEFPRSWVGIAENRAEGPDEDLRGQLEAIHREQRGELRGRSYGGLRHGATLLRGRRRSAGHNTVDTGCSATRHRGQDEADQAAISVWHRPASIR